MSTDEDYDRWLDKANDNVKKQAWFMKRHLDAGKIREALECASLMTGELRTSNMSPKNYYELYMRVTDELRELELFFEDEDAKDDRQDGGHSIVELYENVQHAGNIIPRLYLLTCVASVYIKSKKAPAKDILIDLVELNRGVQHPMRGLFLRHYLSQVSKDKLPDSGNQYEGVGGTVKDSISFILQNFGEMNKLWVRMQHQGAVKDRNKREKERANLKQLVGFNLEYLSKLNGVDLEVYKECVLPQVLEQIVNCKDKIAQEYLMEVVIQVFPDEFHLQTLEIFLSKCAQLQAGVDVKAIIIMLMKRLANFAMESPEQIPDDLDMFPLFHTHTNQITQSSGKMALGDILALQVALVNFASKCYPDRINYIDNVLGFSVKVLEKATKEKVQTDSKCTKQIVELLSLPLDSLSLQILNLESYAPLMGYLEAVHRKTVATTIVKSVVRAKAPLDTMEKVEALFKFVGPLLCDEEDDTLVPDDERFEFDQEQHLIAQLFHLINNEDTDMCVKLYAATREHFKKGGPQRIEYTLPPLVLGSLQLVHKVHQREVAGDAELQVKTKKVFGFIHETIGELSQKYPDLSLRLFLQGALMADKCSFEAIAYEFVAQAFICYEDEISDSKLQFHSINYIVSTLQSLRVFGQENYDTLVSKATQHCWKLLKKTDSCRAVCNCSHLFWAGSDEQPGHRDEKRVLACLQRSLKIANTCMGHQVHLFVEILNKYLYFFDRKCPSITVRYLQGLLALIEEHIPMLDNSETSKVAKAHYQNTLGHIKLKSQLPDDVGQRYSDIQNAPGAGTTGGE